MCKICEHGGFLQSQSHKLLYYNSKLCTYLYCLIHKYVQWWKFQVWLLLATYVYIYYVEAIHIYDDCIKENLSFHIYKRTELNFGIMILNGVTS